MPQRLPGPVNVLAKVEGDNRRAQTRRPTTAALLLVLFSAGAEHRTANASPSVDRTTLTDENLHATLESHRIVVMAGCTSDRSCEILKTELERAAKILARVAQDDTSSMALGSVALHHTVETAVIKERYRFAAPGAPKDDSVEPNCQTKVVLDGLETDFGLTDDGSPPLVSNLARSLVTAIMREIVPGAKAQQENAGLVTELTSTNFDKVLAQTKKEGRPLLINFYQPPVCLHWPGEYANAARKQHSMSTPAVMFAKLNVAFETELVQRLGVGQPAHDFWHLYRDAQKIAEHSGERSEGAMLKFLAENSQTEDRKPARSGSLDL